MSKSTISITNHPCPGGIPANYDETLVPVYQIPELLRSEAGQEIITAADWENIRRPELLEIFRKNVYGNPPPRLALNARMVETGDAFDGLAVREQVALELDEKNKIELLIYRPKAVVHPVPVFLSLNFKGNHANTLDPAVILAGASEQLVENERGSNMIRWPFEKVLAAGYAVATFCHWDVAPDDKDLWRDRFVSAIYPDKKGAPEKEEAGAVAWWAWGLSRAMDYLVSRPDTYNPESVVVMGHSRQGKAALWAAAEDPRFAIAISNDSGCTGAALARRRFGETVRHINSARPDWFCGAYKQYDDKEDALPVDQHQLIALAAPRPVYIASATEDLWADPRGEYLSGYHASPVYTLYQKQSGLDGNFPNPETPVGDAIGYHLRTGKHHILPEDWEHFIRFAQRHLKR